MQKKILPFYILFLFSADIFADNHSLDFDGSNDVVNFGDMNEFNSKPEVSVSFWFMRQVDKPNNSNHGVSNILFSHGSDPYNDNIEIGTDGANVEIYVDCAHSDQYASSYNAGIQNNIWYHLAFTYNKDDPDGSEGRLYINGSYAQSWNHWGGNLDQANNSPVSIGDTYHIETPFDGYMDELIIWNIAISPLAINEIYNGHNPLDNNANYNESSSVAGYWNFNEGNGSILSDLSGNGNNGTIYGATWSDDVPQNAAPKATAQSVTGNEDVAQTITLAGSDAEGDALTYALATDPSNGTSTLSGNVVTYTPNENYNGSDSFTFTVSDGQATSSAATVNITVTAVNDAPTASAQSASGNEDETQTIILTGSDADGDALTYTLGTNPSNGTVNQDYSSVLDFDGANDYVNLPDFSYLNDFSFSAWFKIDSRNYWERIFDFGKGGQGDIFLTTMGGRTQGNLELTIHPFGGTYTINPGVTCDDGQWHHVVFTYDKGGTGMVLYIDGENKGSNSYNTHSFSDFGGGQNFYLGKANWNDPYYDGKMEQVGLYDTALSADAVAEIYGGGNNFNLNTNTGNYNSEANLIGYWKMDEGTGSSAIDHSGNGNNGTINGASWITQGTPDVITYTPNANYNGSDSFTFTSSDGVLTSSEATVDITVTAVNDFPVIASTPALDALDGSLYEYSLSVNDVDGDAVVTTATTKPDWLTISNSNSNSLNFDGSNDYGLIPDNASLDFGSSDFTIEYWINKHANSSGWSNIGGVNKWNTGATPGSNEWTLSPATGANDNIPVFAIESGNTIYGCEATTSMTLNTWYHIAGVRSGTNLLIYVNGQLENTVSIGNISVNNAGRDVLLAKILACCNTNGQLDEIRIWNLARSQSEIQANMNSGLSGNENGLVGYWNLDEGSGTTLTDQTSNGNDGTINGASWSTDVPSSSYVLSGTPGSSDGGLHDIILSANDGNGGVVTQSYTVAVSLHSLEITGESGFRILSSPVSGTIYGDLLEELWTQGAEGSDNSNSNPNIWTYGNGWNPVTDFSSDALTAGQGFLIYVFADTDFDGEDDLPVTISIDGTQQQSATSVVSEPSDWNLIGNPYGLSVDISQMLSDNNSRFNSTVYSLDRTNPGYRTHNGTVGNIQGDEIKPFDGFWIQADTDGNVFEFTEQSIRRGSINSNGRTTTDESSGSAVFTFTNGGYSSSTYLSFTSEGHINLDPADANRLVPLSPAEHLTSMIYESSKSLAINNLPYDLSTDISMDMDVMMLNPTDDGYATEAEQVDLTWDITNLPEGITLVLRNNITGQNINLTGYPSAIISLPSKGSFSTSGDFMATYPVVGQSQFTLSVYGTLAAAEDDDILPERLTLHSAYPNPFNPSTIISFDLSDADMVSLDIFDIAGRQVASLISEYMIPGSHQINWNPGNLSSGIYLVNLVVGTETLNQKITYIK